MTKLKILTDGHPILKKKAKAVAKLSKHHVKLMDDMLETMKAAPGIGLAAPQVGVPERIIVVSCMGQEHCLANPKMTKRAGRQVCNEGCLSVPGLEGPVERFANITVTGMDRSGKQVNIEAKDMLAVVFQHEMDHLDGILFTQRVKDPSLIIPTQKSDNEKI